MKILKENISEFKKELSKIKYQPMFGKSLIVFPIDKSKTRDIDGISLNISDNNGKFGSEKSPDPILIMQQDTRENVKDITYVVLGFGDLTYARKFDFMTYCDLLDIKLSRKQKELFENVDCYLLDQSGIMAAFDLN